jgi:hypothetical protein
LPPRDELREVDRDESDEAGVGLVVSVTGSLESFRIPGLVGRDLHSSFCKHGATESLTELLVAFLMDLAVFDEGGGGGGQKLSSSSIKEGCKKDDEADEYADDDAEDDDESEEVDMESLDELLVDFFISLLAYWSVATVMFGEFLPDPSPSSLNPTVSSKQCFAAIPRVAPPSLGTEAQP